jgi:hypothetical protein
MSTLILSNSTGQIECTISQTYDRLTKCYVGPLSNSSAGFLIQNGAKQTGLFLGNTCNVFGRNLTCFRDSTSPVHICSCNSCLCFSSTNDQNIFIVNPNSFSIGSSAVSSNSIELHRPASPSLVLRSTSFNCCNSIKFLNSSSNEIFSICQIDGAHTLICGSNGLQFKTSSNPSICLSENKISFNGEINSLYNQSFYGDNLLSGNLCITGIVNSFGKFTIDGPQDSTLASRALQVKVPSYFTKCTCFEQLIATPCVCVSDCLCAPKACILNVSGSSSNFKTNYNCVTFFENIGHISPQSGLYLTGQNFSFISGLCVSNIRSSGIQNCGNFSTSSPSLNVICGCQFLLCSTGSIDSTTQSNCILGGLRTDNFYVENTGCVNYLCAFGAVGSISCFNHNVCVNSTFAANQISGINISGTVGHFTCISGNGTGILDKSIRLASLERGTAEKDHVLTWSDLDQKWIPKFVSAGGGGGSLVQGSFHANVLCWNTNTSQWGPGQSYVCTGITGSFNFIKCPATQSNGDLLCFNGTNWVAKAGIPDGTTANSALFWNGTSWIAAQSYVATGQTGQFESSSYARTCFVNTGQTGNLNFVRCPSAPLTVGCVICWNGSSWVAGTAAGGGGGGGTTLPNGTSANSAIRWDGTAWTTGQTYVCTGQTGMFATTGNQNIPLSSLNFGSAINGQFLSWNGTSWGPANAPAGGGSIDTTNFVFGEPTCQNFTVDTKYFGGNEFRGTNSKSFLLGGDDSIISGATLKNNNLLIGVPNSCILNSECAFLFGGSRNCIQNTCHSFIHGSLCSLITSGSGNSIIGGVCNRVCGIDVNNSFIQGGCINCIFCSTNVSIVGGNENIICCRSCNSFIDGGSCNLIVSGRNNSIIGGCCNIICANFSRICLSNIYAGRCNRFIAHPNGASNIIESDIYGGFCNTIYPGSTNYASPVSGSFILGGSHNDVADPNCFVGIINSNCYRVCQNNMTTIIGSMCSTVSNSCCSTYISLFCNPVSALNCYSSFVNFRNSCMFFNRDLVGINICGAPVINSCISNSFDSTAINLRGTCLNNVGCVTAINLTNVSLVGCRNQVIVSHLKSMDFICGPTGCFDNVVSGNCVLGAIVCGNCICSPTGLFQNLLSGVSGCFSNRVLANCLQINGNITNYGNYSGYIVSGKTGTFENLIFTQPSFVGSSVEANIFCNKYVCCFTVFASGNGSSHGTASSRITGIDLSSYLSPESGAYYKITVDTIGVYKTGNATAYIATGRLNKSLCILTYFDKGRWKHEDPNSPTQYANNATSTSPFNALATPCYAFPYTLPNAYGDKVFFSPSGAISGIHLFNIQYGTATIPPVSNSITVFTNNITITKTS